MQTFRSTLLVMAAWLALAGVSFAQATVNMTTLAKIVDRTQRFVVVTTATGIQPGHVLFTEREAMRVVEIRGGNRIVVERGVEGTVAVAHPSGAVVWTGPHAYFSSTELTGICVTLEQIALPRIALTSGNRYECVGGLWRLVNPPGTFTARSVWFNLDNGPGATVDDVVLRSSQPVLITAARIVYVDTTTGNSVSGGNARIGTTVGGAEIAAATDYENTKPVGSSTSMTILNGAVPANTPVIVRHTGVAAPQAGQAVVEIEYSYR